MDTGDDGQDQEEYRQEDMDLSEVSSGEDGAEENDAHPDNWGLGIGRRFINILRDRTGAWVVRDFRPLPEDSSPGPDDEFSENLANSLAESLSRTPPANEVDETAGSSQAHNFDTELPTNHSYLGRMESVSGMEYYEPGKRYKIHVCYHHSIIFPGQKLPMILSSNQAFLLIAQSDEHSVGLVFPPIGGVQYGVTCQVYEKNVKSPAWRTDLRAILRAHQRFRVCTKTQVLPPIFMRDVLEVEVEILPELSLGHPLSGHFRGSLEKFLPHSERVRLLYSHARTWPLFVYEQYDIGKVMMKIKHFVAAHNIENMPIDPIMCSFWSAKNLPLEQEDKEKIFATNYVEVRMMIISQKLNDPYYYHCHECQGQVAKFSEVFAMSKDGVQASYCNPGGFIHDTVTLYNVERHAVVVERSKSTEFSWFPGYAWKIAICSRCRSHLGWQFVAEKKNLRPQNFFGLSQRSIVLKL